MGSHGIMDEDIRDPELQKFREDAVSRLRLSNYAKELKIWMSYSYDKKGRYKGRNPRQSKHEIPLAALMETLADEGCRKKYGRGAIRCIGSIAYWSDSTEKEIAFQVIMEWLNIDPTSHLEVEPSTAGIQLVAIEEAGFIGDPRASDLLLELLKNNNIPEAVIALGKLGDPRAISDLADLLQSSTKRRFSANESGDVELNSAGFYAPSFADIATWMSNIDKEYTILKIRDSVNWAYNFRPRGANSKAYRNGPRGARLQANRDGLLHDSVRALCEIGGIVALGEVIRMDISKIHNESIIPLLDEQDNNELGRAYEHLGLLEEAEKWYTSKGLFDDTARVRKSIAEMGAAKVSQKVVQGNETITINKGDETITIQDSVVMESVGGIQATGLLEQLERLGQMKKDGLLSDEEFMLAKQKLLND